MSVIRHPNTAGATLTQWRYTATGGETSLSGTDGFSTALSYTVGSEQVFINGVLLERGVDYAATTGTTITGLTALVANDIATVISPSSFNVANAIPKSTVTAKGDLLAATGASTVTNLPVGADGTTLVADSSTSTGLRYNPQNALVNPVINGGFDIWQRGISPTWIANNAGNYTADRWMAFSVDSGRTVTRQPVSDSTRLPNIQYCARYQRTAGNTATNNLQLIQNVETVNAIPFAGKTVTLSFYVRAGANFSGASNFLTAYLYSGTGTDENLTYPGYTGVSTVASGTATLTTNWQRQTITGTVSSVATELAIQFAYGPVGTAGASDYFEITGVQIDLGTYTATTAPAFRRSGGTLQGELAACQRYFFLTSSADGAYTQYGTGQAYSTSAAKFSVNFPTAMRIAPTSVTATGNIGALNATNTTITSGTITVDSNSNYRASLIITGSGGIVAGNATAIMSNGSTSTSLSFSAEL